MLNALLQNLMAKERGRSNTLNKSASCEPTSFLKMEKEKQIKKFKEIARKYNVPLDLIDFKALVDSKLSFEENKARVLEVIEGLASSIDNIEKIKNDKKVKKESIKKEKEEAERIMLEQLKRAEQETEKEFEKSLNYLKNNKSRIIDEIFKIPINFIKSVARGFNSSFIFLGRQGLGKTTITLQTLLRENSNFVYKQGYLTPLQLYKFLYEHKEGYIIVFDDVSGLISNFYSLSLILSALWSATDKRKVSWNSTSGRLDIPTEFIFNSRIIFIANKIPSNEYAELVMSRCLNYEINLSYRQILMIMTEIAKMPHNKLSKEERLEIVDFIKENTDETTKDFDLRIQKKIENLYLYDKENWRDYALALLNKKDEKLAIVKRLLLLKSSMKDIYEEWRNQTGLSARQFRRYREKLEQERKL